MVLNEPKNGSQLTKKMGNRSPKAKRNGTKNLMVYVVNRRLCKEERKELNVGKLGPLYTLYPLILVKH